MKETSGLYGLVTLVTLYSALASAQTPNEPFIQVVYEPNTNAKIRREEFSSGEVNKEDKSVEEIDDIRTPLSHLHFQADFRSSLLSLNNSCLTFYGSTFLERFGRLPDNLAGYCSHLDDARIKKHLFSNIKLRSSSDAGQDLMVINLYVDVSATTINDTEMCALLVIPQLLVPQTACSADQETCLQHLPANGTCSAVSMVPPNLTFVEQSWHCQENSEVDLATFTCISNDTNLPDQHQIPTESSLSYTTPLTTLGRCDEAQKCVDRLNSTLREDLNQFCSQLDSILTCLNFTNEIMQCRPQLEALENEYELTTSRKCQSDISTIPAQIDSALSDDVFSTPVSVITATTIKSTTMPTNFNDSWGVRNLENSTLVEGDIEKPFKFTAWINRTHLGCQDEKQCDITIQFRVVETNPVAKCFVSHKDITQIVLGRPLIDGVAKDHNCNILFGNESSIDISIPLKARLDGKYDGMVEVMFQVHFSLTRYYPPPTLTTGKLVATSHIKVRDGDVKATCKSINDPHITTFDGLQYNNYYEGEFILYKHANSRDFPYEVHAVYQKCSLHVNASCNCAVAVKSGDDVIVIDRCSRKPQYLVRIDSDLNKTVEITRSNVMSVDIFMNGKLTPGTHILQQAEGKVYLVLLPSGMEVKVTVNNEMLNVWVVPTGDDKSNTVGLCGTYNERWQDDCSLRDGSVSNETGNLAKDQRAHPNRFIKDWRVELYGTGSILRGVAPSATPKEEYRRVYCQCPNSVNDQKCAPGGDLELCDLWEETWKDITSDLVKRAIAPVLSRRKRQTTQSNQNVVIQTLRDPIDINPEKTPQDVNWVFPWNVNAAEKECWDQLFQGYTLGQLCKSVTGVNFDQEVETCKEDIKLTQKTGWINSAREALKEQCLEAIKRNTSLSADFANSILGQMCINDCSNHGQCRNGACLCQIEFTSADCSVPVNSPPYTRSIEKQGVCDVRASNCSVVIIFGNHFIDSENLTCHLQRCEFTASGEVIKNGEPKKKKVPIATLR